MIPGQRQDKFSDEATYAAASFLREVSRAPLSFSFSSYIRACPQMTFFPPFVSVFLSRYVNHQEGQLHFFFFLFFSNQTKHKLYINKQISSFIFPVGCQTCQGPLLLNCQHSTLRSPNWAYMSPSFLSLPHTHTQHYTGIYKLSQTVYVTEVTVVVWIN